MRTLKDLTLGGVASSGGGSAPVGAGNGSSDALDEFDAGCSCSSRRGAERRWAKRRGEPTPCATVWRVHTLTCLLVICAACSSDPAPPDNNDGGMAGAGGAGAVGTGGATPGPVKFKCPFDANAWDQIEPAPWFDKYDGTYDFQAVGTCEAVSSEHSWTADQRYTLTVQYGNPLQLMFESDNAALTADELGVCHEVATSMAHFVILDQVVESDGTVRLVTGLFDFDLDANVYQISSATVFEQGTGCQFVAL